MRKGNTVSMKDSYVKVADPEYVVSFSLNFSVNPCKRSNIHPQIVKYIPTIMEEVYSMNLNEYFSTYVSTLPSHEIMGLYK